MRSHVLVNLAPACSLVTCEPAAPQAAQPRADASTFVCTAAHLATYTAAATSEPSPSPLPTATTQPVTTPTAAGVPAATAAPVSDEELKPAILTLRDVTVSQMTEGDIQVKAEAIAKSQATI